MKEKRIKIDWEEDEEHPGNVFLAFNCKRLLLGLLSYERVGVHWHFCWVQDQDVLMSPGQIEEVRLKQKELINNKRKNGKKN